MAKREELTERLTLEGGCFADTNWRYLPPFPFEKNIVEPLLNLLLKRGWKIKFKFQNLLNFYKKNTYIVIVPSTGRLQIRIHPDIPLEGRRDAAFAAARELDELFSQIVEESGSGRELSDNFGTLNLQFERRKSVKELEKKIREAFENPELLKEKGYREAVEETIELLDTGKVRVAEKVDGEWKVNDWVKEAILLYFRVAEIQVIQSGAFEYFDKIPLKKGFEKLGVRVVPPATIRKGAFVESGAILMPSYVNIGAYVGSGTMIDTWATVGSCAQVGRNVHISGGVGLGGVLEPPSARPVIIEDGAFIGSRCIIVEGVIVEEEAVLAANVSLTSSTKIIDVTGSEPVVYKGRVPARSVVVPGARKKEFPAGEYYLSSALIIGKRKESTDKKTSLNQVLREFNIPV